MSGDVNNRSVIDVHLAYDIRITSVLVFPKDEAVLPVEVQAETL